MSRIRNIAMKTLYRSGVAHLLKRRHQSRGLYPVLLFHRVSPEADPFWPPLSPEDFRKILTLFKTHYRFRPLEELYTDQELPTDAAFISFDDAFQDFEDHALPILQELDLPATLFVPTGSIDDGQPIWPSLLDRYVDEEWENEDPYLEFGGGRFHWGTWREKGKEACAAFLKQTFMGLSYKGQMEVRERLKERASSSTIVPMSWESLKTLPASIELGAHTVHHPYLPSVQSETHVEEEMMKSKERLEAKTGRKVASFAYPFGGYDDRCARIASKHFDGAFTTEPFPTKAPPGRDEPASWRIPRIDVYDTEPREAFLRVNGFHRIFQNYTRKVSKPFGFRNPKGVH